MNEKLKMLLKLNNDVRLLIQEAKSVDEVITICKVLNLISKEIINLK